MELSDGESVGFRDREDQLKALNASAIRTESLLNINGRQKVEELKSVVYLRICRKRT